MPLFDSEDRKGRWEKEQGDTCSQGLRAGLKPGCCNTAKGHVVAYSPSELNSCSTFSLSNGQKGMIHLFGETNLDYIADYEKITLLLIGMEFVFLVFFVSMHVIKDNSSQHDSPMASQTL